MYLNEDCIIPKDKVLHQGDFIIATIGTVGKIGKVRFDGGTHSNNTFLLRLKHNNVDTDFLEKLFQMNIYRKYISGIASQKAQPNLQQYDLENLKIPIIPYEVQLSFLKEISPIEEKIKQLKQNIVPNVDIINTIFAEEFGYNKNLWKNFGKGMSSGTQKSLPKQMQVFDTDFTRISKNTNLRFSTRFHNPKTQELMHILDSMPTLKVKDVLQKDIRRGVSPQYVDDGDIPVLKIGDLQDGKIDISKDEFVLQEQFDNCSNAKLEEGELVLCSIGKCSLGKIEKIQTDESLFCVSDLWIISINKEKYTNDFFLYFFKSILGTFQMERDYTGATNQIHLYADAINVFKIPNISLEEQNRIVSIIGSEIKGQDEKRQKINDLRNGIDSIMEKCIRDYQQKCVVL